MSFRTQAIIESLQPLIREAREKGLILRTPYQGIELTPDEFEAHLAKGEFVWGPVNWTVQPPTPKDETPEEAYQRGLLEGRRVGNA